MSTLEHLPPLRPEAAPEGVGPDHPMRAVTRDTAFTPESWTPELAHTVAQLFDDLAPDWHLKLTKGRMLAVDDALDRGGVRGEVALEIGSGTGFATPHLLEVFPTVVALDISTEMLKLAPAEPAPRLAGDASALPLPDASMDAIVLVNALLFPAEVNRVLRPDGAVVWVNSLGDRTPIYLPAQDVADALPGRWSGFASQATTGTWTVLRRETP